jgi:hypothetical protein
LRTRRQEFRYDDVSEFLIVSSYNGLGVKPCPAVALAVDPDLAVAPVTIGLAGATGLVAYFKIFASAKRP